VSDNPRSAVLEQCRRRGASEYRQANAQRSAC
jgi:hypothetical protein